MHQEPTFIHIKPCKLEVVGHAGACIAFSDMEIFANHARAAMLKWVPWGDHYGHDVLLNTAKIIFSCFIAGSAPALELKL